MTAATSPMLEAALALAAEGLPVLPLDGKLPIGKLVPHGSKDATTQKAKVVEWWNRKVGVGANVGVATGHELPGGGYLTVIDVDGDEGRASLRALVEKLGPLPPTRIVKTGGGGLHYYYRTPEPIRNSQARKGGWDKVDVRGTGGYVVAPPSVHESGGAYELEVDVPIVDLPHRWLEELKTTTLKARVESAGGKVPVGARHETMVAHLGAMRKRGFTHEAMFAAMRAEIDNNFESPETVPDENIWKAVRSMDNYTVDHDVIVELTTLAEALDHLRNLDALLKSDPGAAMTEVTVDAYISAQESDPVQAERTRAVLRKHRVSLKMFDAMVKKRRAFLREQGGLAALPDFDGAPIKLDMPEGWGVKTMGVFWNGDDGPEQVIPVPLYLTRRVITVGDQEERVEIQWERDGEWHRVLDKRSVVFGARSITQLADRGLPVTSENASRVVRFLAALEAANRDALPLEECTAQAGWIGASRFYPGAEGAVDFEPAFDSDVSERSFASSGDYDEWKRVMLPLLDKYPLMRLHFACAFAAPLLKLIGHRNFVVHLWGPSGGGKSAALTAAMSVWGSPINLIGNFNTTAVGLEQRMGMFNGLPVALNERQVANKGVDKLIYMAGEGTGRTRGARDGGLRRTAHWQMILLTNGEEPIVTELSREGERTRVLEYEGRIVDDEADSARVYECCEANFGWAGRDFIHRLIEWCGEGAQASLKADHARWKGVLAHDDRVVTHTSSLALVAMADALAREWVFEQSAADAQASAEGWALGLVADGHSIKGGHEGERSYERVVGLVQRHLHRFERPSGILGGAAIRPDHESWGYLEDGKAHFIVPVFDDEMRAATLSPAAVKRQLDRLGRLETEPDGRGGRRYYRRVRRGRYIVVRLPESVWGAISPSAAVEMSQSDTEIT